jgi:hypothetical protein
MISQSAFGACAASASRSFRVSFARSKVQIATLM